MSRTQTIQNAVVEELIYRPNEAIPLSVSYKLLDNAGDLITVKRVTIPVSDLPSQAATALSTIASRLLAHIITKENL